MANPDVSTQPILSEQTGRYKRNTLIASLIITVLYFTDAPLGNVKFFGVGLSGVEDREAAAWFVFAVIAFYQWVMMAYYGWRDWCKWDSSIKKAFNLSPRAIAFTGLKGAEYWVEGCVTGFTVQEVEDRGSTIIWRLTKEDSGGAQLQTARSDKTHIRLRLIPFLTFEFLIPLAWGAVCVGLAAIKAFGWLSESVPSAYCSLQLLNRL